MSDDKTRYRLPVAMAFAAAAATGGLFHFTSRHEGVGPVVQSTESAVYNLGGQAQPLIQRGALRAAPEAFAAFVKKVEPLHVRAYPDPGHGWKVPTICYGHTRGVTRGMTATMEQCERWLIEDYERLVLPVLERYVKVPVSIAEATALADFVFNVGGPQFSKSTLLKKLNAGDYEGAANEFPRWIYSNGEDMPGLVIRRQAERDLFLSA
ncbi:MAG: lysozyme [Azoarcus sp.]|jgi:lysozyme|nr:lysozyme [Azoarcus sp.]